MTSEVAYDRRFELLDLDSLCSNVSMASNCYRSQDVSSCFLLLPLLKPCQDGTLTSRASLGSKNCRLRHTEIRQIDDVTPSKVNYLHGKRKVFVGDHQKRRRISSSYCRWEPK